MFSFPRPVDPKLFCANAMPPPSLRSFLKILLKQFQNPGQNCAMSLLFYSTNTPKVNSCLLPGSCDFKTLEKMPYRCLARVVPKLYLAWAMFLVCCFKKEFGSRYVCCLDLAISKTSTKVLMCAPVQNLNIHLDARFSQITCRALASIQ
jgi:hypothetical protein